MLGTRPHRYGTSSGIAGIKLTTNREITIAVKIGTIYLVTPSIFTRPTPQPTNRQEPTGGVTEPIPRFIISISQKCAGLIPTLVAIGRKIGVKISTAGVRSRNIPITSRNIFMIKIIIYRLLETLIRPSLIAAGIPE